MPFNQEQFLEKSKRIHGDKYDYSKAVYKGSKIKLEIVCPQHGSFWMRPEVHWDKGTGCGCPICGKLRIAEAQTFSQEDFVLACKARHNGKYDYSKAVYTNSRNKVIVICPSHGEFSVRAGNHMLFGGCPKCNLKKRDLAQTKNPELFVQQAKKIHGSYYDYSKTKYSGATRIVIITCPKHGDFKIIAGAHIHNKNGCPSCTVHFSLPQKFLTEYVQTLGVKFEVNTRRVIPPKEIDLFIPDFRLGIEMNGIYWHSAHGGRLDHQEKFLQCQEAGVQLLQIFEHEWDDPTTRRVWESIIASKLGKQNKIHARKTVFSSIERQQAEGFLSVNHLQGKGSKTKWHFGLFYNSELVGVMNFSIHQKGVISLSRMAFKAGVTIVGGANKLFVNALKALPHYPIVTFSNNRYSAGNVYRTLGFQQDESLKPSYEWFFKSKVWNKRRMRHKYLPSMLGVSYDPSKSEVKNMKAAGAHRLWDAGYVKWVYNR